MKKIPFDMIIKTVGATYGPKGRTIMIQRSSGLLSTKDGQSVFFELWPEDREEKIFLNLIQEAVTRINKEIGDGTTTSALLFSFALRELEKNLYENPNEIVHDLKMFSLSLDSLLDPLRRPLESRDEVFQYVLSVGNQERELAEKVTDAILQAGTKGLVSVEEGKSRGVEVFQRKGYKVEKGFDSVTLGEACFEECLVAIINGTLEKASQIVPILEEASQFPYPLTIFSKGVFGEALKTLTLNHGKNGLNISSVSVPGHPHQQEEILLDLAALSGSTVWVPEFFRFESEMLGSFEKVLVKKESTMVYSYADKEEFIMDRIREVESKTFESSFDSRERDKRVAMLSEGFIVLEVGGVTLPEIRERKARVEDILAVSKIALEEGIVPGGGMSFLWLSNLFRDSDRACFHSLSKAFREVWKFLVKEHYLIEDKLSLEDPWIGYDLVSETIRDFRNPLQADSFLGLKRMLEVMCSLCSEIILVDGVLLKSK